MRRQASNFVDFQSQARQFSLGDRVVPFGMFESQAGRVVAVWPAIGMVDVSMVDGQRRFPVEDLQKFDEDGTVEPTGGDLALSEMVPVSAGPQAERVAKAHAKRALYWAIKDRQYRMTRDEIGTGKPCCPRCADHPPLKRAIYKRRGGASERLMGCPGCMFLIKTGDIINLGPGSSVGEIEIEASS